MRLVRLLAGTLVSSALFSSSTTMAYFPMPDSVESFYKKFPNMAEVLTDGFRKVIVREVPLLKCIDAYDIPDDSNDSFMKECEPREYGERPFAIEKFGNGNFRVLKFEDVRPKAMVFECINSSKGVCYRLKGVGEYGNGPKDGYEEIRALVDFLIQKYFFELYKELKEVERDFFFYTLAERLEDCTDVYNDY